LAASSQQIEQFSTERVKMKQDMQKSFMRGVCALNIEAMTMFKQPNANNSTPQNRNTVQFEEQEQEYEEPYQRYDSTNLMALIRIPRMEPPMPVRSTPQSQPYSRQVRPPMPTKSHNVDIVPNDNQRSQQPAPMVTRHNPNNVPKQDVAAPKSIMKPKSTVKFSNKIS
jgi:hypothetical protein